MHYAEIKTCDFANGQTMEGTYNENLFRQALQV